MSVWSIPYPGVRDGALRRQNRVLIWIDGHIPSRVIEFFLTDWMNGQRIGYVRVSSFDQNAERQVVVQALRDDLLLHLSPLG